MNVIFAKKFQLCGNNGNNISRLYIRTFVLITSTAEFPAFCDICESFVRSDKHDEK